MNAARQKEKKNTNLLNKKKKNSIKKNIIEFKQPRGLKWRYFRNFPAVYYCVIKKIRRGGGSVKLITKEIIKFLTGIANDRK